MGANQSAGRSSSRSIPVRPRTPLRFGSVPTPMPVDPYEYNTRPVRNLYPNIHYGDSITSMLSQENYLSPSPSFSGSPEPEPSMIPDDSDGSSSGYLTPNSASWGQPHYRCSFPNCAYSVIGFRSPEELDMPLAHGRHYAPQQQTHCEPTCTEPTVFGWTNMQVPTITMLPEITPLNVDLPASEPQQDCVCPYCIPGGGDYLPEWQMYQPMPIHPGMMQAPMMMPPPLVGYNGPEVENLLWNEGEVRPEGYRMPKRQRVYY